MMMTMMNMKKMMNKMKKKNNELYKMIDAKTKVLSHPNTVYKTVTIICNGFPEKLFEEWKEQCKEQFNDMYWAKIWNDHLKAQAYNTIIAGGVQYVQQEQNNTADEHKKENDSEPVVFGDGE